MALNENLEKVLKIKDNNEAIEKLVSVIAGMQEKIEELEEKIGELEEENSIYVEIDYSINQNGVNVKNKTLVKL